MWTFKFFGILVLSLIVIILLNVFLIKEEYIQISYLIILIAFIVGLVMFHKKKKHYMSNYIDYSLDTVIKSFDKSLEYSFGINDSASHFINSEIYRRRDLNFGSSFMVSGKYKETEMKLSKMFAYFEKVKKVTKREDKGDHILVTRRRITKPVPLFTGYMFVVDFNKDFKGKTILKSKEVLTKFKSKDRRVIFKGKTIKMEDEKFNDKFEVFSEDDVESRYILTPIFMEKILELQEELKLGFGSDEDLNFISKIKRKIQSKFNKSIELSFVDSKMYLLVNNNEDLFNYSFYSEKRNTKETKRFYEVISKFIQIIDKLELNTRIWNK